jgi:hypothetical protein
MKYSIKILIFLLFILVLQSNAQEQKPKPFSITGDLGIWYEGYGLNKVPGVASPDFYQPRRPWNLLRFSFNPVVNIEKWSIPFNFNFSTPPNNFVTPVAGGKQSFWQVLTNPANAFGIRPKMGSIEILLGTQYLKYSDLSTGDLGIFGYGINFSPGKFRFSLFNGISQNPVNYVAPTLLPPDPGITGAYQRNLWIGQIGLEQQGKYFVGFNFVHASDLLQSVTSPPLTPIDPQENMVVSFLATVTSGKGWNYHVELGQSFHTRNINNIIMPPPVMDLKPFITAHISTDKDNAVMLGLSKKGKDWEIGVKFNYIGAGYFTSGFQFMTNDRIEYLLNSRFVAWKKKMNIVASIGNRLGNVSHTSGPSTTAQIIANINVFTQFTDKWSLNMNFNNFGFNSPGLSGYKSVSNELSINPTYSWGNTKMNNLLSATYTLSKYNETTSSGTTANNTQTALLLYVPTVFASKINPDVSLMWFNDKTTAIDLNLFNATAGLTFKASKKYKFQFQLQYILSTTSPFTADKNLLATGSFDWKMYQKLSWQFALTGNLYHYGSDLPGSSLIPVYMGNPQYFESTLRTSFQYKF